jgi:hypothetical protein
MPEKITNVIDCLKTEPLSKRGIIPIPFATEGSASVDWTMQNANIFVKNIHFFAVLIDHVAKELNVPVGEYTHWITNICHDRDATSC